MVRTAIAIVALVAGTGGAFAQGDAVRGEAKFTERCSVCHSIGDGAAKNAPTLNNIIGRPAASIEGFSYSDGMIEAAQAGVVWDVDTLTKFITKPRSVVNGSNMSFTGLRNPDDVADVIAYLATFAAPQTQ